MTVIFTGNRIFEDVVRITQDSDGIAYAHLKNGETVIGIITEVKQ